MRLSDLHEAKIKPANQGMAMSKIISYLEKKVGKMTKLTTEKFKNSSGSGTGVRYVLDGSVLCVRFNWTQGKSSEITSVDLWTGTSRDPNFHISWAGKSLATLLPSLAQAIKKPSIGVVKAKEEELTEAKKGEWTERSSVNDMIEKMQGGRSFNRSEFIMAYHPENAHAYDAFVEKNKDKLTITGKRISMPKGAKLSGGAASDDGATGGGSVTVSKGGKDEQYDVDVPDDGRVSYNDSLEHLESLTHGLIKGSFNALFVAGKGGTGKTQTVEDVLSANGLSDGQGYFKVTGSASPIGMYTALYKYRDDIILFDDCDGALESQDGRNIIKAATDTKKTRKLSWGKKSAGMYDPQQEAESKAAKKAAESEEDPDAEGDEDEDDTPDDRIPNNFIYTGQVIFISNLPLSKLDPDGALRTRAFIISIDPTPDEIIERMSQILGTIKLEGGLTLSDKQRTEVLNVIKAGRRKNEASLRTLVRALNLAASGAPNWQKLVQLYA